VVAGADTERLLARAGEIARYEMGRLLERSPGSAELHTRAMRSMPKGVASNFQAGDPYPVYLSHATGAHVWDVDGLDYLDFHGGFGVNVVGHAHPKIVEAVTKALSRGSHFAVTTPTTVALAEEINRRFGWEQMRFVNSGTEATMDAIRVARAATGRDRIVKMEGSYHGHHDAVLFSVVPEAEVLDLKNTVTGRAVGESGTAYTSQPTSKGVPRSMWDDTIIVPYNDPTTVEEVFASHGEQIAALILEPVMMNIGIVAPKPGYLEALRAACDRHRVVLIFDEVKCGGTIAAGGATERYGVQPDLACLAKAVGGGLTIGAFGGKASVMDLVTKGSAQQGTFNGNPVSCAAGLAALTEVLTPDAYVEFARRGTMLAEGCSAAIAEHGIPAHTVDLGAKGCVSYRPEPLTNYRDFFMTPGDEEQWTLSVQHADDDIQAYIDAFAEFCAALAP
jgi:glutamate-1-semialdehyde 2,1-aminomutase